MPTFCVIDGTATVHRAYHALPRLTTSRGEPVNAVYGFIKMVTKLLKEEKPEYIAVCFDAPAATFRHGLDPSYKANRAEMDDELRFQMPLVREAVQSWGLPALEQEGWEADDLIASLARAGEKKGWEVLIVTGDKDALQLVGPRVTVFNDAKGVRYDAKKVEERFGIGPDRLIDFFCLTGDAVDNIPGVPGIGEKTASRLLQEYGSLEGILMNLDRLRPPIRDAIKKSRERLELNRRLIALADSLPLPLEPEACRAKPPNGRWGGLLQRLEFSSLLKEWLPASSGPGLGAGVEVVRAEEALRALVKDLEGISRLSLDLETSGVDPLRCDLVGVALAFGGRRVYLPVGHRGLETGPQLEAARTLEALRPFLENPKLPKWGQNLKYDRNVLAVRGIRLEGIEMDTLVAAYCLNPSRLSYRLKDMALDLLGERMRTLEEVAGTRPERGLEAAPVEEAARYAAADAEAALRLGEKFFPEIREKGIEKLFSEVEIPLVSVLGDMEAAGIRVDAGRLRELGGEFEAEKSALEERVCALTGRRFNLNSPKQLAQVLFEELKLPVVRRTKTGYSTDEETLTKLRGAHPACGELLAYREISKLKSTYIDALLDLIDPATGRVHTSFNQAGTATGRLSSSDPNLQNIPVRTEHGRKIRRAFVPGPRCLFVSADYSQIDLRVLAHMSKDPALTAAFRSGGDVHTTTAAEVFHTPPEKVTPEMRKRAKAINFGIVYGQQAFGLSQQLGIPVEEAQETITRYFARYAGVRRWIEETIREARETSHVSTILGRRRALPEIQAKNPQIRSFAERAAVNTPIQGTSADIIKLAMIRIQEKLRSSGAQTRMLVQVHDELLFEVPEEERAAVLPSVKETMEKALELSVPLVVDLREGPNWADMTPVKTS